MTLGGLLKSAGAMVAICFGAICLLPAAATALPDGYAYEKVSPADKGNGEVWGGGIRFGYRASIDGDHIAYGSDGVFAGTQFNLNGWNAYQATRSEEGWLTGSAAASYPFLMPPDFGFFDPTFVPLNAAPAAVSADGKKLVTGTNIDPETGDLIPSRLFIYDTVTGDYEWLAPMPLADPEYVMASPETGVTGTDDFGTIYFSSPAQLTPDSLAPGIPADADKLYRYRDGQVELASFDPAGNPAPGVTAAGRISPVGKHVVSADGNVVFFYAQSTGLREPLYRIAMGDETSVMVNQSEADPVPVDRADFGGATPDGNRVVFVAPQQLTSDASGNSDVYIYNHESPPGARLTLLSLDENEEVTGSHGVERVLGVSDDLSTVYFLGHGKQLVPGEPNDAGTKIYRWNDGTLGFITNAQVAGAGTGIETSMATPDGRYLVFRTAGGAGGLVANQVYLYDSVNESLVCASCNPSGITTSQAFTGQRPNTLQYGSSPRRIIAENGRIFFETAEALVPEDTNGVIDVYTWHQGKVDLVSGGRDTYESRFADASADGSTIFFHTREQLTGWDTDDRIDLYAARLGGGLPEPNVRPDEPCAGDECQPALTEAPDLPVLGSKAAIGSKVVETKRDCRPLQRRAAQLRKRSRISARRARLVKRMARPNAARQARRLNRRAKQLDRRAKQVHRRLAACRSQGR